MAFTNAAKATMVDALLSGTIYVSLHTATPGTDGANELSGNDYARQLTAFTAAGADGITENTGDETFGPADPAGWTEATYFGLWSAATDGTFHGGFALTTPRTVAAGDSAKCAAGDLTAHV